jgi:MATE family multidrug resistance protein
MEASGALGEEKKPLLENNIDEDENEYLVRRVWIESKKLWQIAAPAIFNRVGNYSMLVITQVFAGHLGDMELAATSIAMNVILGLDLGIMVS